MAFRQTVLVEGVYDRIRLESAVSSPVLAVGGFSVRHNREMQALLRRVAEKTGVAVFTDPDGAGERLRGFLASILPGDRVWHVRIPAIPGRERRKAASSARGILGVEGVPRAVLESALARAGLDAANGEGSGSGVDGAFFYGHGLAGTGGSAERRRALLLRLGLPRTLSSRQTAVVLNILYTRAELDRILGETEERN